MRLPWRRSRFVRYRHDGRTVWVRRALRGKHRDYCLCWECELFAPGKPEENCPVANAIHALECERGVTTPVWECRTFLSRAVLRADTAKRLRGVGPEFREIEGEELERYVDERVRRLRLHQAQVNAREHRIEQAPERT
jgi:hypothetical protein